ncbi:MAG: hypothetical protein K1X74_05470 [Pirellulales bacterium]|nr:hypothetical protein [Pirellulales bacterium]
MSATGPLDNTPLWLLFIVSVALIYAALETGYRVGRHRSQRYPEKETTLGAMTGAMLGLLAFILAFTFGLAASRFDDRRHTILDEANAIGTTYLRAKLLPQPQQAAIRRLLKTYVDTRLSAMQPGQMDAAINASLRIHDQLWNETSAVAAADSHSIVTGLFIQSLNEMIDLHATRVMVGLRSRIPGAVWAALYAVAILTMATLGFQEGVLSNRRSLVSFGVVLAFTIVLFMTTDLDRPREGLLQISQQTMLDLQQSVRASEP